MEKKAFKNTPKSSYGGTKVFFFKISTCSHLPNQFIFLSDFLREMSYTIENRCIAVEFCHFYFYLKEVKEVLVRRT